MSARLPANARAYKRTPTFDEVSVPVPLLRDHSTKEGVWGLLQVEHGRLRYVVADPRRTPFETILTADAPTAVIEPTILHYVEPLGPVQFHIEFYQLPSRTGRKESNA